MPRTSQGRPLPARKPPGRLTAVRVPLPTAAGLIVGAAVLLTGCSGAGPAASSGGAARAGNRGAIAAPAAAPGAGAHAAGPAAGAPAAGSSAGQRASSAGAARLAPAGQNVVFTAAMGVRVGNVSRAATRATAIADSAGGYVSQENAALHPGAPGGGQASIQLKIPVPAYPATLSALAGLGIQTSLRQQAQDVTQQVADTASRVASDKAVISQLRGLLSHAGSVSNLLVVQDQISSQESALEAMQAQQRAFDHETAYATVSLQILGPVVIRHAGPHVAKAHSGFVAGLTAGWKALVTLISWLLSVLGAVLPIGAACALAGYLGYRGLRGRRWLRRGARPDRV